MGCIQSKRHHDDVYEPGFNFVRPRITNYHKKREREEELPMMIIMGVDGPTHWDPTPLHHFKLNDDDDDDDYIEFHASSRKSDPIDPEYDPISDMIGITSRDITNRCNHQSVGTVVIDREVDYSINVDESDLTSAVSSDESVVDSEDATTDIDDDLANENKSGSTVQHEAGDIEHGANETEVEVSETVASKNTVAPELGRMQPCGATSQPIRQQTLSEAGDAGHVVTTTTNDVIVEEEEMVENLLRDMMEKVIVMTIESKEEQMVDRFLEVIFKAVEVAAA